MSGEEADPMPENYLLVDFVHVGEDIRVHGFVEDVALALYSEGRIKQLPVLQMSENLALVITYYDVAGMSNLKAYPQSIEQLEAASPDTSIGVLDEVQRSTDALDANAAIPTVPVAGPLEAEG